MTDSDPIQLIDDEGYTRDPIGETGLAAFEKKHGIRFPPTLRNELLRINGGQLSHGFYRVEGKIYGIVGFYGIIIEGKGWPRLHPVSDYCSDEEYSGWPRVLPSGSNPALVFFFDYLMNTELYFALDFSNSRDEPSVLALPEEGEPTILGR